MARATQKFLDEIRRSHRVFSYVDAISPTQEVKRLVVIDGDVTVDRTAQFRRGLTLNCIDPTNEFVPQGDTGLLTPFGTELRPYRGVQYDDGTVEVYPLGVFRLSDSDFVDSSTSAASSGVRISLKAMDRSRTVSRDKFTTNYTIPTGTNLIDAIKLILARTFDDLTYDAITTGIVTTGPKILTPEDDPWDAVTALAKSCGCEIYFNVDGWVTIIPPTDIDALPAPDFYFIEGQRTTLLELRRTYSDANAYNGIIVTGASASDELPPVRAEAWDMEPSSPTYRLGPYGEVPLPVSDTNVKTTADAQAMADSLLKGQVGAAAQLSLSSWTNPAIEAGDVIEVERPLMYVSGLYTVDAFNIPLQAAGTQSFKLRTRRTVA
jgi:hypothetical protein